MVPNTSEDDMQSVGRESFWRNSAQSLGQKLKGSCFVRGKLGLKALGTAYQSLSSLEKVPSTK